MNMKDKFIELADVSLNQLYCSLFEEKNESRLVLVQDILKKEKSFFFYLLNVILYI